MSKQLESATDELCDYVPGMISGAGAVGRSYWASHRRACAGLARQSRLADRFANRRKRFRFSADSGAA